MERGESSWVRGLEIPLRSGGNEGSLSWVIGWGDIVVRRSWMTWKNDFADGDWVFGIFIKDTEFPTQETDASIRVICPDVLDYCDATDDVFCFADSVFLGSVFLQVS